MNTHIETINPGEVVHDLIQFIKTIVIREGFRDVVIGVSGGVDSAVCLCLSVKALGYAHVFPYLLPYGALGKESVIHAKEVITFCGIPTEHVVEQDIQNIVDSFINLDNTMDNLRKGNVMARVRMILLFDAAKKRHALVMGTENKSEHYLGYYTRFGDEASDIEPLRKLYKTQVYALAKHLNVPSSILIKPPSANLWEGQSDEREFGFTYEEADTVLTMLVEEQKSREDAIRVLKNENIIDQVLSRIKKNAFKHNLPYTPKKSKK